MRKFKVITTQYHVLSFVQIDKSKQEVTCEMVRGMYPTETTSFAFNGGVSGFLLESDENWTKSIYVNGPSIQITSANVGLGCSANEVPYVVVGIQPKKREVLEKWYESEQVDLILDPNTQDDFVVVFSDNSDIKKSVDSFDDINSDEMVADDEIVFI